MTAHVEASGGLGTELLGRAELTPPGRVASAASRAVLLGAAKHTHGRAVDLEEDGGRRLHLGGPGPAVQVQVHDRRSYGALLLGSTVGLGSSYVAGWWDADDLTGLVRALSQRSRPLLRALDALGR